MVKGYDEFVGQKIKDGYIAYLVSFMFNQLPGDHRVQLQIMEEQVRRWHRTLTYHVVRKPESTCWKPLKPILIGCPDSPVRKRARAARRAAGTVANDGWHFNAVVLVPPKRRPVGGKTVRGAGGRQSRLKVGLIRHLQKRELKYLHGRLQRVHVKRIEFGTAIDYAFKTFKAGRFSGDSILIL